MKIYTMKNQKGQILLILILVMTVALAIGISVVQRSLSDISTASKIEQSSRAFSAAEAGIEKAISLNVPIASPFNLDNNATIQEVQRDIIANVATSGHQQDPWECPPHNPFPLAKEDVAQVWLADYTSTSNPPPAAYKQTSLDIYWGNSTTDKAALELTLIYYDGTQYKARKWYLDHVITRSSDNKFTQVACTGYTNTLGTNYSCKYTIGDSSDPNGPLPSSPSILMLLRARLLYNTTSQPFAVQVPSTATCGTDCSIPAQTKIYTSTGTSGQTQRKVQVCQTQKVVPPYFDYAIFSTGEISK